MDKVAPEQAQTGKRPRLTRSSIVQIAILTVGAAASIVAIAGLGAVTDKCVSVEGSTDCAKRYALAWWCVFFEMGVFAYGLLLSIKVQRVSFTFCCLLACVAALDMYISDTLIKYTRDADRLNDNDKYSRGSAASAGFVLMAIVNLVLLLWGSITTDFGYF